MATPKCKDHPIDTFFPPDDEYSPENVDEAMTICDLCPVLKWCGATFWNEPYGVFAGTTPQDRGFKPDGTRYKKMRNPYK